VARIPERLRHRRFWYVQAMVVVATAAHYWIEITGFTATDGAMHDFAITLYFIPLLYAAMSFGWEGAFMTGLWSALLTSPSTWIWHHSQLHWVTEVMQLGVAMCVGIVVAWRVDRESKQRRIAERTSASLSLLNKVGETLSRTMEVEQRLPLVIDEIVAGLGLQSVILSLEPETAGGEPVIIARGAPAPCREAGDCPLSRGSGLTETFDCPNDRTVVIALDADSREIGSLAACTDEAMGGDRANLLATICHEIAVAVENGRLYRQRQEGMHSYVRQVTQAHEDERLRIARELHDDTAQELVHLVRRLEKLDHDANPVASAEAREALGVARNILKGVRRFSRDLRPSVLDDLGLLAGIEMVVDQTNELLPGGARLRISGEPRRLDPQVEVALFRIAQEALRNVTKHAHAETAHVWLAFEADHLTLTVEDDGVGLSLPANVSDLARLGKLGVLGMKERAELVGGVFEVTGGAVRGTALVVRVPCTARDEPPATAPTPGPRPAASIVREHDIAMPVSPYHEVP
jgi:signal transduction histidine kinase